MEQGTQFTSSCLYKEALEPGYLQNTIDFAHSTQNSFRFYRSSSLSITESSAITWTKWNARCVTSSRFATEKRRKGKTKRIEKKKKTRKITKKEKRRKNRIKEGKKQLS